MARASSAIASSPESMTMGTPKCPAMAALTPASGMSRPFRRNAVRLALDIVCARTPRVFAVLAWYPMKRTASKVESIPSIIPSRRGQDRTSSMSCGRRSMSRFSPLPCESLTRIVVAPACRAASIAAFTSAVMISRKRSYSKPAGPSWSDVTVPTTPSMSAEM